MFQGKTVGVIVPAAGTGSRMGGVPAKQFLDLNGKSILLRTLEHFQRSDVIDLVVVIAGESEMDATRGIVSTYGLSKVVTVTRGGVERQDSVWNGLQLITKHTVDIVMIHDAVRPFISQDLIESVIAAAVKHGAAVPAVSPKDTIKLTNGELFVQSTLERNHLWIIQTPQAFQFPLLRQAFEKAQAENFYGTDDASLVERLGKKVKIVPGSYDNIKITTPEDLELAELIAKRI
ncbi:MAG: 2-C-methyl-D-erythritol 4-phosphate cytidylyltransferase [Ignavibacteriae bacterium]|nr:2-C-methyl-D-erythritol 4-phosphate cytidylyltransferase [Ignavibacteriota bacterium]